MVIKPYQEPMVLRIKRCLNQRMEPAPDVKQYYLNLEKGCEGEQKLAVLLEDLPNHILVLHDLLLESGNTAFQVDALLLAPHEIHFFEAKNYEGDFYIDSEKWYTTAGKEIQNPVLQLNRSESLLRQWLRKNGSSYPVKGRVIFTHPEFTLFQAPLTLPIVLPTQLNRYINKLKTIPIKPSHYMKKLAEKFVDEHINESPYKRLPQYKFEELRKGIICGKCGSFLTSLAKKNKIVCYDCRYEDAIDASVMRTVEEFRLLFPNKRITTPVIHEWCKVIDSQKMIRRILYENFIAKGYGRHTHFVDSDVFRAY